ncbi:MAG: ligase-associated DNA damage response DEXH box helicase [Bacteroidota bacterium]
MKQPSVSPSLAPLQHWYAQKGWTPFPFQLETAQAYLEGKHGLLNAPTGSGKTYALWVPILLQALQQPKPKKGLKAIWITPLRALSKDIVNACQQACDELETGWTVEARTGDTSSSVKSRQKQRMPQGLVTTPESMHVLFAQKEHHKWFENLQAIVVYEWHELLGTKRGTQTELVIAHLKRINPNLQVWGISATIGNLPQALDALLGSIKEREPTVMIRARIEKQIAIHSVLPDEIERFPWSGHLGLQMIEKVLPIVEQSRTTLLFTNTRAQAELWYQALLDAEPNLAGIMAMHHGSIASDLRAWVEEALHNEQLKLVVCTSSLDLGVDFRPVDTIIQVGGPKGVARFLQRAGRSGHQPGAVSNIYFVPTHSLELIEAAAIREAVAGKALEDRPPIMLAYDVLQQFLMTLAVADGFLPEEVYEEIRQAYSFRALSREAFDWCLDFLVTGGNSLYAYEEYQKVILDEEDDHYRVLDKRLRRQHLLSIGTIVSDSVLIVKYLRGGRLGTVEESFISQVKPGDTFWFSGKSLELIRIRNMEVQVKKSKSKKGKVPRWMGSRMILSSQLSYLLRKQLDRHLGGEVNSAELRELGPMFDLQQRRSAIPRHDQCLLESISSKEGHHLYLYPFEGRVVHEILGALLAWRIGQLVPRTFSIAMNDYGLELLSDQPIPLEEVLEAEIFSPDNLESDLSEAINETEMVQRRFREIARVAGLVFQGFPGKPVKDKHLQASTSLLYKVFQEHDPNNLLLQQAYTEVLNYQIDGDRLKATLERLQSQQLLLTEPSRFTPFCFPIMVDRLRERLSSEKLVDRIARMQVQLERE